MTVCVVGRDRAEALERARRRLLLSGRENDEPAVLFGEDNKFTGTVEEVIARLRRYEESGVDRAYLRHLDHQDLDMVRLIGAEIAHAV